MRRAALIGLVLACLVAGVAQASGTASLAWPRYDVDIQINTDGTLTVTEIETIQFSGGSYHKGFAVIPQKHGSISNVNVWEGNQRYQLSGSAQPNTFTLATNKSGDIEITWYFPATSNSTHTFNLQYTVRDGLLYYPGKQYDRLQWQAIAADHQGVIAASEITVHLPSGAPIFVDETGTHSGVASGDPANATASADRQTASFTSRRALSPGEGLEIRLDFQHGVVAGSAPAWQTTYDLRENYKPLIDLISLGLCVLIIVGGSLLVLLRWYTAGRDPQAGLAAEYVAEPPGDLPPGVVGTLVDERADMQDIIATLIDLARRGVITMEEEQQPGFMGIGMTRDFVYRRVPTADLSGLRAYEKLVLDRVIPNQERKLSALKNTFYTYIPELQRALYKETVKEGLFPVSPDTVRTRWMVGGIGLIVLAMAGGIVATLLLVEVTVSVVVPFIGLGIVGVIVSGSGSAMPVKTRKGAEAKAAWLAFKRYLSNLEKYTRVQEATDQFDKYLPYAVAFGIDRTWINKFARVEMTPVPMWYFPYGYQRGMYMGGTSSSMGGGLGHTGVPSVQGMSNGLAGSLQSMSTGLTSMLNSAASTFSSRPSSSSGGGGWSGGGFSGGGGGGGGSRGFG